MSQLKQTLGSAVLSLEDDSDPTVTKPHVSPSPTAEVQNVQELLIQKGNAVRAFLIIRGRLETSNPGWRSSR